ncbi:hypothetical protein FRB95_013497 [Tulasnella sp. JGI-2019a]|nr:hypothetical protein FRB95_013497 [Tulasnella sp. JGI-2019a]
MFRAELITVRFKPRLTLRFRPPRPMNRPTNENMDRALSLLALSLNHGHGANYDFFANSNTLGSPEEIDQDVRLMQAVQSSLNNRISIIISKRHSYLVMVRTELGRTRSANFE